MVEPSHGATKIGKKFMTALIRPWAKSGPTIYILHASLCPAISYPVHLLRPIIFEHGQKILGMFKMFERVFFFKFFPFPVILHHVKNFWSRSKILDGAIDRAFIWNDCPSAPSKKEQGEGVLNWPLLLCIPKINWSWFQVIFDPIKHF